MATGATSSVLGKRLIDMDTRFEIISQSMDDRTKREKNLYSRYSMIKHFLSNDARMKNKYNDLPFTINKKVKKKLIKELRN